MKAKLECEWDEDFSTLRITAPTEIAEKCLRISVTDGKSVLATLFSACGAAFGMEKCKNENDVDDNCPYCHFGEVIAWDLCGDGIVIESDGTIHMMSGGDWESKIKYCPMCGRKL